MKRIHVAAALMSLCTACSHHADSSKLELSVGSYCEQLESELQAAAAKQRQLAPALDAKSLSPEQLERAGGELAITSIGTAAETRRARLRDFEARLRFCERVRETNAARPTTFEHRLDALDQGLNQDVMSGAMPTATNTAEQLEQLATLAHEVNGLPFQR